MSYLITFFVGALLGGVAVWIYRAQISDKLAKAEASLNKTPPSSP